jgi:hypothetical protein
MCTQRMCRTHTYMLESQRTIAILKVIVYNTIMLAGCHATIQQIPHQLKYHKGHLTDTSPFKMLAEFPALSSKCCSNRNTARDT